MYNISQTRVRQLVTLVGDWVADNLPEFSEADLRKQVRLAQQIAANRLEHQHEVAMNHWNAEHDPKYLRPATRIALAQARLGIAAGRVHALAANVTEGPLELGDEIPHEDAHAPVGDCSPGGSHAAESDEAVAAEIAATDCPERIIEREREQRVTMVRGLATMEDRLLTLIANQGSANPEKVAGLQETLARVRNSKATAELRLSRFMPGVRIEPLAAQFQAAETGDLAVS
jgi:hypothetical protein